MFFSLSELFISFDIKTEFVLFTRVELFNLILHIYVVSKCLIVQLLLHFYSSRKRLSKVKPKMEFSDFGSRKRISHSSWI